MIGDSGVRLLLEELAEVRSLAHLDLGDNHIGDAGAFAVADACSMYTTLPLV